MNRRLRKLVLRTTNVIESAVLWKCDVVLAPWCASSTWKAWTYSIFQRFNLEWKTCTLDLFTQAS
ncbi:MAG TPA: hypothetical protein VGS27_10835 [Candidatus Sulfotelmatobacter sp.]|nr:hypothetical protein [Candidatus Sulfotelmatobacter sp.]